MKYFCIDTSGAEISVGAAGEREVYLSDEGKAKAGRALMPMLDEALGKAGMTVNDAEFIAVVVGPGSFTGLRIGVSAARSLAYALDIPVVPVNSCELAAYNSKCHGKVLTVSDAGNGYCFVAVYDGGEELMPPTCIREGELEELSKAQNGCVIAADSKYSERFGTEETKGDGIIRLALEKYSSRARNYKTIEPLYVRKSQAEADL
ncbi:MAG: tRNA (adenosine(37)-N6)-threonylcarbamoyltransferase complex dimerization subunit type 1 TsaB [Clostridia bacterium]|nr:tRNA (adenosine(37)-N6)-threonylcarbamoyltransferase complex dimerization subunit type 1 TsaB [Clostridia bacterium]